MKTTGRLLMTLGLALVVAGCGSAPKDDATAPGHFAIAVTEDGFEPANVKVAAGTPVTLMITRKTEKTCATEVVIADYGINQKLPLDETVQVTFTPKGAGTIRFACGMDMIAGEVIVE